MKKQGIVVLVLLTVLFTGFLCGFYLGRISAGGDTLISKYPPSSLSQSATGSGTQPDASAQDARPIAIININTATKEQLMTLPGIGEVLAERIVSYRAAKGPFRKVHDLLKVEGIGEKRLDAILEYLTV